MTNDDIDEPLAKRLYRLRTAKGLSISQVARSLGVSASTYREWEYGRKIKGEPYPKLAQILDVSLNYLLLGSSGDLDDVRLDLEKAEEIIRKVKGRI